MAKILIIEDEKDMAQVFSKRLSSEGYEVIIAFDAYHGYALARKEKPDVILLDLMLPAGGGLKTLEKIRSTPTIIQTPVIVITASHREDNKNRALEAGANAYMEKPCDMEKLKETIQKFIIAP